MYKIRFGIIAGLVFGILDVIPMFWMAIPDPAFAMMGALINRFAIGFIIPTINLPIVGWLRGLFVSILLSLPDAIITGVFAPIMGFGIVGGLIIGILVDRSEKFHNSQT